MADSKISALPASTTPLAGTEVLPIVQSGSTKQVSVANLTAGRAIAATSLTASGLTSGRVPVIGASGLISDNSTLLCDSTNNFLGIGISPVYRLHVVRPSTAVVAGFRASDTTNNARNIIIGNSQGDLIAASTTTGNGVIYSDTGKTLALGTNGSSTGRLTVATGGDVTVNAGNLVIGTAGKGIDFSADPSAAGMTSALLDDYEEGTFTPVVIGTTTAGTATYGAQKGVYTKIGNVVYITICINWSAGDGTGNLRLSGLPFTTRNDSVLFNSFSIGLQTNLTLPASTYLGGITLPNTTAWALFSLVVGGGSSAALAYDGSGEIEVSGFYFV